MRRAGRHLGDRSARFLGVCFTNTHSASKVGGKPISRSARPGQSFNPRKLSNTQVVAVFFTSDVRSLPVRSWGLDLACHGVLLLHLRHRHQGGDRIKVLKFRTPRWVRFATTHISHGLGVSTAAFTQGPRDLPKDAMDLLYLSRTLRRVQSVLQRLQVEASSKVLIHGHRVLQLLMHARPRILSPTDACESPCHKPRLRGLDRNLATSASANLRRVPIDTHVLAMHLHRTTDGFLRVRGPYSHTMRAGTVSPVCLTFPTLWLSVVSRLKVSPCQVHHVYTPKGARSRAASQV